VDARLAGAAVDSAGRAGAAAAIAGQVVDGGVAVAVADGVRVDRAAALKAAAETARPKRKREG
jgi:hypothetical protein